jgi:hypothetical protein
MIGALVGIDGLPKDMIRKVMSFDVEGEIGNKRPKFLSVKD